MDTLVDLFLHLDTHLAAFVAQYGGWVYGILFAIVFAETGLVVTPFLPGDSLLFATGALCATGAMDITLVGALIGRRHPRQHGELRDRPGDRPPRVRRGRHQGWLHKLLNRQHLDKAHAFFEKHAAWPWC